MQVVESLVPEDFRSSLTTPLRQFYICTILQCVGSGLTLSFFVVYLHNVRGFSTGFSTLLLAFAAIAGLASSPLWGTLTDRFGPLRVVFVAYAANALALIDWAFARTEVAATIAAVLLAVFGGAAWGPSSTLLSRLVIPEQRQRAFGFNFMLVNLGVGLGSLISATIVDLHHPLTFTFLYLTNAGVMVVAGLFLLSLRAHGGPVRDHLDDPQKRAQGWATVLRDHRLVQYVLASLVLMIGGYGSQEAGFSLFVVNDLKMSVHVIGIIFFFNTSTIVLTQLWVLNRISGRSRTRVLASAGVLWFVFWVVLDVALSLPPALALISLCVAMVIFAIGETMMSTVGPTLVNEIAPEHLRGRYNAAAGIGWGVSGTLAPAITALYFDNHLGTWWPLSTGLTALVGSALLLNFRRRLTAREDGREVNVPAL